MKKIIYIIITLSSIIGMSSTATTVTNSNAFAEVTCLRESDQFVDETDIYYNSRGADAHYINIPEKYKKWNITKSVHNSTEPVQFEVSQAGLILVVCHKMVAKTYMSNGWREIEQIDIFNKRYEEGRKQPKGTFVLLTKHYDKGTFKIGGETYFGGVHLLH